RDAGPVDRPWSERQGRLSGAAQTDDRMAGQGRADAMTGETTASHLLFEKRNGIAYVTLNRPAKRNAFSPEMIVRLVDTWKEIANDASIRVVLLTGAGNQAFSSGGDLGSTIPLMMRTRPPVGEREERLAPDRKPR